ncbi:MAG: uracil-DNA glycosylase [Candidatus Thiodiazotropha sp.]
MDLRRRGYLKAMGVSLWRQREEVDPAEGRGTPDPLPEPPADSPAETLDAEPRVAAPAVGSRQAVSEMEWPALREQVRDCRACELRAGCTQTVFGVGNESSELLVIGEAPGADEDRQGEPFVGRAGQLLNTMLQAMGYRRESVFIANIVKCRPPDNRDPRPEEAMRCEPYLLRQIALIQPRMILAVGRIAAQNLLKTDITVGKLRGRIHRFGESGIPLVVTYHPAYLLRSSEQKGKAWQDLQLALSGLRGDRV